MFVTNAVSNAQIDKFEKDVISTSEGNLTIHFFGHASLMFEFKGKNIYIDPWSKMADYTQLPKADMILITHQHQDHFDPKAITDIKKDGTKFVVTKTVLDAMKMITEYGIEMANGDTKIIDGLKIEAVPAYNTIKDTINIILKVAIMAI